LHHYPEGEGPDGELIEMVEREVMEKNPNVKFEDIAELEGAKNTLKEAVLLPLLMPDFFRGLRRPWKGVLLYGPPGTGKTLLAKALATQGKTTFFNVSPTTFASKWKGESEKLVRILFEMARFYAPSTIFIDEVDSIGQKRSDGDNEASRKVMAEMLVQMDGVSGKLDQEDLSVEELKKNIVMVMGATNLPWDLDDALRRRFEKRVYIPLPNSVGRREMFKINMKGIQVEPNIDMDKLVTLTDGYSGADIANVCREASLMQMRGILMKTGGKLNFTAIKLNPSKTLISELEAPVTQKDFELAIKHISKSVSQNDIKKYEQFTEEYSNK
jgi:katanin p60 ATPase-containing subunit A1